jgi:hypothetical protein
MPMRPTVLGAARAFEERCGLSAVGGHVEARHGHLTPYVLLQRSKQNAAGRATCATPATACRTPPRAASSNVSLDLSAATANGVDDGGCE